MAPRGPTAGPGAATPSGAPDAPVASAGGALEAPGLHRSLSRAALLSISVGGIIGSGWLFGVLRASAIAGPAAILAWVLGGGLSLVLALSWARMSEVLPESGASARYVFYTHGSLAGFLLGWIRILSVVTIPAIEAEAVVTALQVVLDRSGTGFRLTATQRFVLSCIFDNTRAALVAILSHERDEAAIRQAIHGFWSYQLAGLRGLLRWLTAAG